MSSASDRASRSWPPRSEEHTSELQSHDNLVCRLLLEKKKSRHLRPSGDVELCPEGAAEQGYVRVCGCAMDRTGRESSRGAGCGGGGTPFFFFNDTATHEIYPLSLHDALPI